VQVNPIQNEKGRKEGVEAETASKEKTFVIFSNAS